MSPTLLSSVSLAVLIFAIALGFIKKLNVGILSMGLALVVGMLAGMPQGKIVAGFNTSLFVILMGAMFLFGIAQLNGTMDLLARKTISLAGNQSWAIPIFMYILGAGVAALGPGTIPAFGIAAMFGVPLAYAMRANPFLLCCIGQMGGIAGGIVPWAPTGIIGIAKAAEAGYTHNIAMPLFINTTLGTIFVSIILYIVFRGWKLQKPEGLHHEEIPSFNKNQILTLLGIACLLVGIIMFNTNIGLTSFLIACVLILLGVAKMDDCIKAVPWGTLIMVIGVGVLMNVVISAGGIKLLAKGLASIMTESTAPALISLASGIMSWFSSTSGVVMPTMIPTIPDILANLTGANIPPALMVSAVTVGSSCAGISPASTGGSLILAAIAAEEAGKPYDANGLFIKLFLVSIGSVLCSVLFALIGGYAFTPY